MNISLYDNYSAAGRDFDFVPNGGVAGICDSLLVIVCLRGSAAFRLKSQNVEIRECNALIIAPDTPFSAISHTPDFRADAIRIGTELLSVASEDFMKAHLDDAHARASSESAVAQKDEDVPHHTLIPEGAAP